VSDSGAWGNWTLVGRLPHTQPCLHYWCCWRSRREAKHVLVQVLGQAAVRSHYIWESRRRRLWRRLWQRWQWRRLWHLATSTSYNSHVSFFSVHTRFHYEFPHLR
jgi:hypothetical protein